MRVFGVLPSIVQIELPYTATLTNVCDVREA
jgi:hypothetical protein